MNTIKITHLNYEIEAVFEYQRKVVSSQATFNQDKVLNCDIYALVPCAVESLKVYDENGEVSAVGFDKIALQIARHNSDYWLDFKGSEWK